MFQTLTNVWGLIKMLDLWTDVLMIQIVRSELRTNQIHRYLYTAFMLLPFKMLMYSLLTSHFLLFLLLLLLSFWHLFFLCCCFHVFRVVPLQVFQACGSPREGAASTAAQDQVTKGKGTTAEDRAEPTWRLEQMVSLRLSLSLPVGSFTWKPPGWVAMCR